MDAHQYYTEKFTCKCGEKTYLLHTDEHDPSTWCKCGLRISQQRVFWQNLSR